MLDLITPFVFLAAMTAIVAFVWMMLFTGSHIFSWVASLKMPAWIKKPLYSCPMCCTGQWAWWTGIFYHHLGFGDLIGFIALAMFFAWLLDKLRQRL